MSLRSLLFFLFSIIMPLGTYAQLFYNERPEFLQANNIWCFGAYGGLDFSINPPTQFETQMYASEGTASVADPVTGELLFYTSGRNVLNRNHQVMPNSTGLLNTGSSTMQGVCIVPVIGDSSKYYLFTLTGLTEGSLTFKTGTDYTLHYSVIDMALDNTLGDVIPGQKNIGLDEDTLSEAMIAIPGNNCDVWLMVHKVGEPVFKAWHITANGIDPEPVLSTTGTQIQGPINPDPYFRQMSPYGMATMSVSPDRSKLAISSYNGIPDGRLEDAGVLVCDFNANTGEVSNAQLVDSLQPFVAGTAFSPDNSKLYFVAENYWGGVYELLQYDISSMNEATIAASRQVISSPVRPYDQCAMAYLKLYKEHIYVLPLWDTYEYMGVIQQPNLTGGACNFDPNFLRLERRAGISISNEVVYAYPPDTNANRYLDTVICWVEDTSIARKGFLSARSDYAGYIWDNGDTGSIREIDSSGTYWVLCMDACHSQIDTFQVTMVDLYFDLGKDSVVCADDRVLLQQPELEEPEVIWAWQDGSATKTYTALDAGTYSLTASKLGCSYTDSIQLGFMRDFLPDLGEDRLICKGSPINIRLDAAQPPNGSVLWNTGSSEASILAEDTGLYIVHVSLPPCEMTDSIQIEYQVCECAFAVPNAFSPNEDGLNDRFFPVIESGCRIKGYMLNVFNRFGQRIYSTTQPDQGWDGMHEGIPVETGTYMWEVRFTGGTKGLLYYRKGDVTLIR